MEGSEEDQMFRFESKMREVIQQATQPLQTLIEGNRQQTQYVQATVQHMATKIDELESISQRATKKANDIYDVKAKQLELERVFKRREANHTHLQSKSNNEILHMTQKLHLMHDEIQAYTSIITNSKKEF